MKIPSKIDKKTHTKLSKQNAKYLTQEIGSSLDDTKLEAEWLINNWDSSNKYMDNMAKEPESTIKSWSKDMIIAFREFKRDKIKIDKAYLRFIESKK